PLQAQSLALAKTSLPGGDSTTGIVTLNGAAPAGGADVSLSTANGAASVPPTVTVPEGLTSATFTITTSSTVTANVSGKITASYGGVPQSVSLTVKPWLLSMTLSPTSVVGGASTSTHTVTLNFAAPTGGLTVGLSSSKTAVASVPATMNVPQGATSA